MREILNSISSAVLDASIAVHREPGPGLLENAYEACLEYERADRGYRVARQKELPVVYRKIKVDCGFRLDLVVNDLVTVERKSVERLDPIRTAQLLTDLKLTGLHLGLLVNFNATRLVDGNERIVREFPQ